MTYKPDTRRRATTRPDYRLGTSLVEVIMATAIVGVLMTAALRNLGGATQASRYTAEQAIGQLLAQDLIAEILEADYADPDERPLFGIEPTENPNIRATFDDVDDYSDWVATPPQQQNGVPINGKTNWRREVTIRYVNSQDLTDTAVTDQGVKEITVSVYFHTRLIAQQTILRTDRD